jgi:hypothetical protein
MYALDIGHRSTAAKEAPMQAKFVNDVDGRAKIVNRLQMTARTT